MTFLKCSCGDVCAVPVEHVGESVVLVEEAELELWVLEHHPHLAEEDYFSVIESAGDC